MALTVEDGTGVVGADAYSSVALTDSWNSSRGVAAWAAATPSEKEIAIREASDYLDINFFPHSDRLNKAQGLAWPPEWPSALNRARFYIPDSETTEIQLRQLRRAVHGLSSIALRGGLVSRSPEPAQILSQSKKLGELSKSVTYAKNYDRSSTVAGTDLSWLDSVMSCFNGRSGISSGELRRG